MKEKDRAKRSEASSEAKKIVSEASRNDVHPR